MGADQCLQPDVLANSRGLRRLLSDAVVEMKSLIERLESMISVAMYSGLGLDFCRDSRIAK